MSDDQAVWTPEEQERARRQLCEGHGTLRWLRRTCGMIPSDPRCTGGNEPFGGIGGKLFSLMGWAPSRKNPRWCNR